MYLDYISKYLLLQTFSIFQFQRNWMSCVEVNIKHKKEAIEKEMSMVRVVLFGTLGDRTYRFFFLNLKN